MHFGLVISNFRTYEPVEKLTDKKNAFWFSCPSNQIIYFFGFSAILHFNSAVGATNLSFMDNVAE